MYLEKLKENLAYVENTLLGKNEYCIGAMFSAADVFLYALLFYVRDAEVDLTTHVNTSAYMARMETMRDVMKPFDMFHNNPTTTSMF